MANLGYKVFYTDGYVDLAEEMGITLTQGSDYQIQLENPAILCVSATQPTKGGFYISNSKPFGYTHTGGTLWIKSLEYAPAVVNIAEG